MDSRRTRFALLASLCLLAAAAAGCFRPGGSRDFERLTRILQAGNEALAAGRHDEAIREFDAGLALSPGHPTFLTNKSHAVRARGVARYNASFKLDDEAARAAAREEAGRDLREAADLGARAAERMKSADARETSLSPEAYEEGRRAAFSARAEALRLVASRFDKTRADEALEAIRDYAGAERDAAKRRQALLGAGQMLLDAGRGGQAAAEYRKVLADEPDNLDAVLGAGLGLFQSGDKANYGEAAAYLRRFVDEAPADHPLRQSAKDALDFMYR